MCSYRFPDPPCACLPCRPAPCPKCCWSSWRHVSRTSTHVALSCPAAERTSTLTPSERWGQGWSEGRREGRSEGEEAVEEGRDEWKRKVEGGEQGAGNWSSEGRRNGGICIYLDTSTSPTSFARFSRPPLLSNSPRPKLILQRATSCPQSQGLDPPIPTHCVADSSRSLPLPPCVCRTYRYINYSAPLAPSLPPPLAPPLPPPLTWCQS